MDSRVKISELDGWARVQQVDGSELVLWMRNDVSKVCVQQIACCHQLTASNVDISRLSVYIHTPELQSYSVHKYLPRSPWRRNMQVRTAIGQVHLCRYIPPSIIGTWDDTCMYSQIDARPIPAHRYLMQYCRRPGKRILRQPLPLVGPGLGRPYY